MEQFFKLQVLYNFEIIPDHENEESKSMYKTESFFSPEPLALL